MIFSPSPSISSARRCAKCHSACLRCAGQNRPPVQRAIASSGQPFDLRAAHRTLGGHDELAGVVGTAIENRADHFGNHVAGTPHDHRIADADVLAAHFVFVVQRRVRDRRAADEHRREPRNRRDRAGAADLHVDREQLRERFLRGEFVRERKARRARHEAELVLLVAPVDLVDDAVDVVRQAVALLADLRGRTRAGLRAFAPRRVPHSPASPVPCTSRAAPACVGGISTPSSTPMPYAKNDNGRCAVIFGSSCRKLPAAALRGFANSRMLGLALARVQPLEIALEHQHFAAHVEPFRHVLALEFQRNRADRADVCGDVLAGRTVAARGGLHEAPSS